MMFDRIKHKLSTRTARQVQPHGEKGQSLVEIAIIAPLLIFFMLGVFEVGWALRGHIVLSNANREITRFAVRPGYLDYSNKNPAYHTVLTHTYATLSSQLSIDFDANSTMIISHLVADTGYPCDPDPSADININNCNCNAFDIDHPDYDPDYPGTFTLDDLVLHPDVPGYDYYTETFPNDSPVQTRMNYAEKAAELVRENNELNCKLLQGKSGVVPSANNVIITELFFNQPQLFGFPLVSNAVTDPISLYTNTAMRIVKGARTGENVDTVGPVCDAYPFVIHEDTVENKTSGDRVDIFDGPGGSDFGWLGWNPDKISPANTSTPYLRAELNFSRTALNDYTNARDPGDTTLSTGDYVASIQGDKAAVEASDGIVSALVDKKFRIPVWDSFHPGTGQEVDAYHIVRFIWVQIEDSTDIDLPGKTVYATYLGDATEDCSGGTGGNSGLVAEVEFCTYNLDLLYDETFDIRDYVHYKDGSMAGQPVDWPRVFLTYTGAGANDPTNPADWHLDQFNAGTPVTVVEADADSGTGNHGDGNYRIYVYRDGQPGFDDHMTIRVDSNGNSDLEDAKCVNQ